MAGHRKAQQVGSFRRRHERSVTDSNTADKHLIRRGAQVNRKTCMRSRCKELNARGDTRSEARSGGARADGWRGKGLTSQPALKASNRWNTSGESADRWG